MKQDVIAVRGARVNNLKNVNIDIPKNKVNIRGKNGNVPLIPPKIPSIIRDLNHSLELANKLSIGAIT